MMTILNKNNRVYYHILYTDKTNIIHIYILNIIYCMYDNYYINFSLFFSALLGNSDLNFIKSKFQPPRPNRMKIWLFQKTDCIDMCDFFASY